MGETILIDLSLLVSALIAAFLIKSILRSLVTGKIETQFGTFDRGHKLVAYRLWMAIFAAFSAILGLPMVVLVLASICKTIWPHIFDRMP